MIINGQSLRAIQAGFNAAFKSGFGSVEPTYSQIAMTINSTSALENYGWLKDMPGVREWIGQRVINNLSTETMQVVNRTWEHTFGVDRENIEDDRLGIYTPALQMQGETFARHPDELVWGLLRKGWETKGYDGQMFFDTDHVGYDENGKEISWANTDTQTPPSPTAPLWFLLDLSRTYAKPLVFQLRKAPEFTAKTKSSDDNVFFEKEFLYGADARYAAAFGFYQFAWGSAQAPTAANYEIARAALMTQRRRDGSPMPTGRLTLVCGPSYERYARELLKAKLVVNGNDNVWLDTADLIVSPYLI